MTLRRAAAWVAATAGALAALAGSPYRAEQGRINVDELPAAVTREDDHVTAIELATWLRDRKPDLRVVDLRTREEFNAYHLPRAESVPLQSLTGTPFGQNETVVFYSDGDGQAAQARVFLRSLGYRNVFFLRGGLQEWLDAVINPTRAANASPEDAAAFERVAALSRYFGGVPRILDAPPPVGRGPLGRVPVERGRPGRVWAGASANDTPPAASRKAPTTWSTAIRRRGC